MRSWSCASPRQSTTARPWPGCSARTSRSPQARTEARWGAIFAAPDLLLILAILLAPLAVLAALSVTDYRLGAIAVRLVGLDNYAAMFADAVFQHSLRNTFLYVAFVLPVALFGGLGVALLVHARIRTRTIYEVIYVLPVTSTLVAMATA